MRLIGILLLLAFSSPLTAAELLIQIGPDPNGQFEDGDVIAAYTTKRCECLHAEQICHVRHWLAKVGAPTPAGSLPEAFLSATKQYKFTRISPTEVNRDDLSTPAVESDVIGPRPNAEGEYMDVRLFIARRLKHHRHQIFGTPGSEYWFGGRTSLPTDAEMTTLWSAIESKTRQRRIDHKTYPLGEDDLRTRLALPIMEITEQRAAELVSPKIEDDDEIVKLRAHKLKNWRTISGVSVSEVNDPAKRVDLRRVLIELSDVLIVEKKR